MGTGSVLAIVMAGIAILLIAKTRVLGNDETRSVVYARDQMMGREARSSGWVFAVLLLIVLFLAVMLAR
jgi:hypothetical protein